MLLVNNIIDKILCRGVGMGRQLFNVAFINSSVIVFTMQIVLS